MSVIHTSSAQFTGIQFISGNLLATLADGRELSIPLEWFPRLRDTTPAQRANWRLIGRGEDVQWEELDEDVPVGGLLGLGT